MTIGRRGRSLAAVSIACVSFACVSIACVVMLKVTNRLAGGKTIITGELVETYCWGTQHSSGPEHALCGIDCAKRGIPVAIVDQRSHKAFVLVPGRGTAKLPLGLIKEMGQQVTIQGEVFERGGTQFATVQSWQRFR
jgi:hypothetical protein